MPQPPQDNFLYFQMFGLTATAPDQLNESMRRAIESMHQTLYSSSNDDLSDGEVELLRRGGLDTSAHKDKDDPLISYAAEFAALLETSLSAAEVADQLGGITSVRVRQMIRDGSLIAAQVDNRWKVPEFQLERDKTVPNICAVNVEIPGTLDTVSIFRWYTTPDPELETPDGKIVSPLDWLKSGLDPAEAIALAQDL